MKVRTFFISIVLTNTRLVFLNTMKTLSITPYDLIFTGKSKCYPTQKFNNFSLIN